MMTNMKKNHYIELVEKELNDCVKGIEYLEYVLSHELEAWERKEYENLLAKRKEELPALNERLDFVCANFGYGV